MYLLVNVLKFVVLYLVTGLAMPWVFGAMSYAVLVHKYGRETVLQAIYEVVAKDGPCTTADVKTYVVHLWTWLWTLPPASATAVNLVEDACKEYKENHKKEAEES